MTNAVVLVVAYVPEERDRLGAWLEEASYEVLVCPGPLGPGGCLEIRGQPCPLRKAADVVVLDLELKGDLTADTAPGWVLFDTYVELGSNVVALVDPGYPTDRMEASAVFLRRPVSSGDLIAAVRLAMAGGATAGPAD